MKNANKMFEPLYRETHIICRLYLPAIVTHVCCHLGTTIARGLL